jgi:hypothetical protein
MVTKTPSERAEAQQWATKVQSLEVENERLTTENWQLKGALGYEVPGHIPCGDFKCGLCEARVIELLKLRTKVETLKAALMELRGVATHNEILHPPAIVEFINRIVGDRDAVDSSGCIQTYKEGLNPPPPTPVVSDR